MGYLPIGQIPKYLIKKFENPTLIIKPGHKEFVEEVIKEHMVNKCKETGCRYYSKINQGYRSFKKGKKIYIAVEPCYYVIKI